MKSSVLAALTGSGLLTLTSGMVAHAQAQAGQGQSTDAAAQEWGLEEIIVTARRRNESLQDVPQTVNAVTAESVEKLNILKFEDVQALVPGLQLNAGNTGYTTSATIRGASFQVESGATPTVEFYLNDSPIESIFLFQSLYDIGQIEVLRGPQGTLRGRASPSGSITLTTRRPDLSEFGGFVNMTGTNRDAGNAQGAINLPIIQDKLAVRVAGSYDENNYDHVRSINSNENPDQRTRSGRVSLSYEPTDSISATVVYQYLDRQVQLFFPMQSFHLAEPTAPVIDTPTNPQITASDRLGISEQPNTIDQEQHAITAQLDWRFAGQKLSYVGSYNKQDISAPAPLDTANVVPAFEAFAALDTHQSNRAHELRLASEERVFGVLDYTVGAFYLNSSSPSDITQNTLIGFQTGTATIMPISLVGTPVERRSDKEETSFFGNLTYHLGERTELSAGLRHIIFETDSSLAVNGATLSNVQNEEKPTIYNVSLSHRFTDDFLVYANHGKSWRDGPLAVGIFRPLTPRLEQFTDLDPETSKSYEVGFKADLFERRVRINASVFRQDFKDFLYRGAPGIWYVDLNAQGLRPNTFTFVSNVDAKVDGAELEVAFQPIERLSIAASLSYAEGDIEDGVIACNDFNRDGVPDRNPPTPTVQQIRDAAGGEEVATCVVNDPLSFNPDWNATLTPEYALPITDQMDGFMRALFTYTPSSKRDPNNPYDNGDAYGLLNLYAGLRSTDGAWEVSVFAKNLTKTGEILFAGNGPSATGYTNPITRQGASVAGYYMPVSYTPPREVGLNIRYAFGSR